VFAHLVRLPTEKLALANPGRNLRIGAGKMEHLQEDLMRASSVARLERIIADLESQGALTAWDPTQRKWFLSFLLPFSQMQGSASRLSAIGRESAAIDTAPVLDELLGPHFSDPSSLAREIDGFVHLYSQLVNETPTLTDDDARRALRLAHAVRSRLLSAVPAPSTFKGTARPLGHSFSHT